MATLEIVTGPARWKAVATQWDELVDASGGGVYLAWGWLFHWWTHAPAGEAQPRELHIVLVWDGDRLIGIAPFFLERRFQWRVEIDRALHLLGGGGESNYHDLVAAPGREVEVADAVAAGLLAERLADRIVLWNVPAESPRLGPFVDALTRRGCAVVEEKREERYVTLLPPTFDAFLSGLHKQRRREYRRATEECERLGVSVEALSHPGDAFDGALTALFDLHARRWSAVGRPHALSKAGSRERLRAMVGAVQARGRACLLALRHRDAVIAARLSLFHPETGIAYGHLCAHDPAWDAFGPGTHALMESFREAVGAGLGRYDHGWGEQEYKKRFKPVEVQHNRWLRIRPAAKHLRPAAVLLDGLRSTRRLLAAPRRSP